MGFQPPVTAALPNAQVTKTTAYAADVNDTIIHADTTGGTFAVTYPATAANGKIISVQWSAGTVAPTIAFVVGPPAASLNTANVGQIAFSKVGALVSLQSDGNGVWTEV